MESPTLRPRQSRSRTKATAGSSTSTSRSRCPGATHSISTSSHSDDYLLARMENLTRRQYKYLDDKYIARTQRVMPDKFLEMCHMHLAFLLDLSGDKLEILLSNPDDLHKKRRLQFGSAAAAVFKKKEKAPVGLFGAPLTDEGVCLMLPLLSFLSDEKNLCKEGLFRKPGNRNRMNALKESLNVHGTAAQLDPEVYSSHDIACVLKEFLRALPEPVLTDKHMEAHRQILDMGKHATTDEMKAHYNQKKLSALQLLIILLPSAHRILILRVLQLLQQVAKCPETKMTPTTLGTIFAPIFFLSRKVDASEMCDAISQTEPALAFMIEHAGELFKAPNQLIIDLSKVWNREECGSPLPSTNPNCTPSLRKSISGQTLNTNICYADRSASLSVDVATNTQTELNKLYEHVQNLPDTPYYRKIKQNVLKGTATPTLPTPSRKKHQRSKSIGASIKKRFPSLGRSKKNKCDMSMYSACSRYSTSSSEFKATPAMSDLLKSPMVSGTPKESTSTRQSRPRHKRPLSIDASSDGAVDDCTSPKQEFKATLASPSSSSTSSECLSPVSQRVEFIAPMSAANDASMCSYVCMTPSEDEDSSRDSASGVLPHSTQASPSVPHPALKDLNFDTEKGIDIENICAKIINVERQQSEGTPNSKVCQMKEIEFINKCHNLSTVKDQVEEENKPSTPKVFYKSCNAPGTPVMPRSVLRLAHMNTLETSI